MRRLTTWALALAAGLFTLTARADVDVRIGIGVPGVVIGTHPRHHYYHPPVRHRHYAPPVYFYPEKVYGGKSYKHHRRFDRDRHIRPPTDRHLRHGPAPGHWSRPLSPPHAFSQGQWGRPLPHAQMHGHGHGHWRR